MSAPSCVFVVESGTDVRLVDGLNEGLRLRLLCRRIRGGVEVTRPPRRETLIEIGPSSRLAFAAWAAVRLVVLRRNYQVVIVQGYALAALVANLMGRLLRRPVTMLV